MIAGALHSYWPIDYSKPVDKAGDRARGLEGISSLADFAVDLGIDLCLEVLNRFENHVLNTADEGVAFVREVGKPNVKVHLDTFHMNIEEDSFGEAIRTAGPLLGHFHTGENNRRVPGKGRLPWHEIGTALREIGYNGAVVMEPFVKMGGGVGSDIKVWRDLSDNADEAQMDEDARQASGVFTVRARLRLAAQGAGAELRSRSTSQGRGSVEGEWNGVATVSHALGEVRVITQCAETELLTFL